MYRLQYVSLIDARTRIRPYPFLQRRRARPAHDCRTSLFQVGTVYAIKCSFANRRQVISNQHTDPTVTMASYLQCFTVAIVLQTLNQLCARAIGNPSVSWLLTVGESLSSNDAHMYRCMYICQYFAFVALVMQGICTSAAMVLTYFSRNIPAAAPEGL